mgnify:FL=1
MLGKFYVYIIKSSKNNSYYVGCTKDIEARIAKHNQGAVYSTRSFKPWTRLYTENYQTLSEARRREIQVKKWKSRAAIERLLKTS